MKKKPQQSYWYFYVLLIAFFILGINQGWFLSVTPPQDINISIPQAKQGETILSSCLQVCSANNFNTGYTETTGCIPGETRVTYGYEGQNPLFICCCYDRPSVPQPVEDTCTEIDGGNIRTVPGITTFNDVGYMDYCLDVGQAVHEYWCDGTNLMEENYACDYGQICVSTRSGSYCQTPLPTWEPGDIVFTNSGTASLIGTSPQISTLDLGDFGIESGGDCRLGVLLSTSWYYANDRCSGIPGIQGLRWDLFDSNGLEYSRIDNTPISLGVNLHPESHIWNYDGQTDWRAVITPTLPLPECSITYEWSASVYIYDC